MAISTSFKRMLGAQNSGDSIIALVDIHHPDIDTNVDVDGNGHFYATSDTVPTTSNGVVYTPYWFDLTLVNSSPDQPPKAQVVINAVDQRVAAAIQEVNSPEPRVTIYIVMGSDPDYYQMTMSDFILQNAQGAMFQITCDLGLENLLQTNYPNVFFDPEGFAGLFGVNSGLSS